MRLIYLLVLLAVLPGAFAVSMTMTTDSAREYSDHEYGRNSGYAYHVPTHTALWPNGYSSLYLWMRQTEIDAGACSVRLDTWRSYKWNGSVFKNDTGGFKQIENTSLLAEQVAYWAGTRNCTVIIADGKIPSQFAAVNTSFCSVNSTSCYAENATLDAQNQYDLLRLLSPNGIYDSNIIWETNEQNLQQFFGNNLARNVTNMPIRAYYMWRNLAAVQANFSVSAPNVRVFANFVWDTDEMTSQIGGTSNAYETSRYLYSCLGNFSSTPEVCFSLHNYPADYEYNSPSTWSSGARNIWTYTNATMRDGENVCAAVYNTTFCNTITRYVTETQLSQSDATENRKIQNYTYGNLPVERDYFLMRYVYLNRDYPVYTIWYQTIETDCYIDDPEYPSWWPDHLATSTKRVG